MRVRINNTQEIENGGVFVPDDPGLQTNLNDKFELQDFSVEENPAIPFSEVTVSWRIAPKDGASNFDDYEFRLIGPPYVLEAITGNQASHTFPIWKAVTLSIQGRGNGASWQTLGSQFSLGLDKSDCTEVNLPLPVIDLGVFDGVAEFISQTAELRYRSVLVENPENPQGPKIRLKLKPDSEWTFQSLKYSFPFEIVIPGYFNAQLDVRAEVRFLLTHDNDGSELDVRLSFPKVDVSTDLLDNIIHPFGPYSVGKTVEKLLPLILECRRDGVESRITRKILEILTLPLSDNGRLLSVRIDPGDGEVTGNLLFDICNVPEEEKPGVFI